MKLPILLTSLIISGLALNAQNIINDQMASNDNLSNWTFNVENNVSNNQQLVNVTNTADIIVQTNNWGNSGGSASQSFGNSGNKTNKVQSNVKQTRSKNTNKTPVQTRVNSTINDDNVNRGNSFDINDNVVDNNVGTQSNPNRGGNVNEVNFNANPVLIDQKKVSANKPLIHDSPGLDFKPSGLSGRDYSGGGKLKKGQKIFYTGSPSKRKFIHKKKPSKKKVNYHTSKCAKW